MLQSQPRLPAQDPPPVVQLASELKKPPFNQSPHAAYATARHAVATLVSPQAAGLALGDAAKAVLAETKAIPAEMRMFSAELLARDPASAALAPAIPAGHPSIGTARFRELLTTYRTCHGRALVKETLGNLLEHIDGHTAELVALLRAQHEELTQLRAALASQGTAPA